MKKTDSVEVDREVDEVAVGEAVVAVDQPARVRKFPSAFTVLFFVLVLMWILGFVITPGAYDRNADGMPVAGTFHTVGSPMTFQGRVKDLFLAVVNGLYGQTGADGHVAAGGSGALFGSAQVFFFILAIGMFITMCDRTGALDAGIRSLASKFGARGPVLIVALMVLFGVLGSVEGFAEETLGLYVLFIPLMLKLGYDRLIVVAMLILGSGAGNLASTVNPFATGVASGIAGIPMTQGIGLRLIMLVVAEGICIWWVLRYAARIKKDPTKSLVPHYDEDEEIIAGLAGTDHTMSGRHKAILTVMALSFAVMVWSEIPWKSVLTANPDAGSYPWYIEPGWYFPELTALFILAAMIIGFIGWQGEEKFVAGLIGGAADFIAPALVIVLARGVTVVMTNAGTTDSVLHALESSLSGAPKWVFILLLLLVYLPLSFLVPSTSGLATLSMPIFAPLTSMQHIDPALAITVFQTAEGWIGLFAPTSAIVMGGLVMCRVGYDKWMRFLAPLLGILFVVCAVLVTIPVLVG